MSIQIKSLTMTVPTKELSLAAPLDTFNTVPTANEVYDLLHGTQLRRLRALGHCQNHPAGKHPCHQCREGVVVLQQAHANGQNRRRLLAPADILLPAGTTYIDDSELTLDPGDKIQAKADTANVIQYIISGVERDVT